MQTAIVGPQSNSTGSSLMTEIFSSPQARAQGRLANTKIGEQPQSSMPLIVAEATLGSSRAKNEGFGDMTPRNPAAPDHLPFFLPTPDGSDPLLIVTAFIVLAAVVLIGVLFFRLHSLPEQFGHKKVQYELVAVLALISLLTHIHLFWVIALVLAMIDLPDFTTPLQRIAAALERRWSAWPKPSVETTGGGPERPLDEEPNEPKKPSFEKSSGERVHSPAAKERKELYAMSAGSEET